MVLRQRRNRLLGLEFLESRQLLTTLPDGFEETIVAQGFNTPTSMTFTPDGRLFVAQKTGTIRVIENGNLRNDPLISLPVTTYGETGVQGIVVDPNFATNGYVYVYYSKSSAGVAVNRLSRFQISTSNSNQLNAASEAVLVDGITNAFPGFHNGGLLTFGNDGKLYLGVGDTTHEELARDITQLPGKILRLNPASFPNVIPADNPFVGVSGARGEIWATGFRNPFTGAIHPTTGTFYVNNVGLTSWEEINEVQRGGDYGWPVHEGIANDPPFIDPVYQYPHDAELGAAVTGGTFYTSTKFPSIYRNQYFFADYTQSFIRTLNPTTKEVTNFTTDAVAPIDLDVAPNGDLYWLSIGDGSVRRISYAVGNRAPIANAAANVTSGLAPLTVQFSSVTSFDPDQDTLTYSWNFGDGTATSTEANPTHIYSSNGTYNAVLTVSDGEKTGISTPITIIVGDTAPLLSLTTSTTQYKAGDTISFSGTAVDRNGVPLPSSAYSWSVVFHHLTHTHPFLPSVNGVTSGSFQIPAAGEDHPVQFYRITLQATNTSGITSSSFIDVKPLLSPFTLATNYAGLNLVMNSHPTLAPYQATGVENFQYTVEAPESQVFNGSDYQFDHWSDGAPRARSFFTPSADNTTTTAIYSKLQNDAEIFHGTSSNWYVGEVRTYNVSVKNNSLIAWSNSGSSATVLTVSMGNLTTTHNLPRSVLPGETVSVPVTVTAPSVAGNVTLTHQMRTGSTLLRRANTESVTVSPLAALYSVSPPLAWKPGEIRMYSITLTNTGTETWLPTGANQVALGVYFGGVSDDVNAWTTEPARYYLPGAVAPSESVTLTIAVQAPTELGDYTLRHRLVQEGIDWFASMAKTEVTVVNILPLEATYTVAPPTTWQVGETKSYSITLTNTGSETWLNSGNSRVNLGVYFAGTTSVPPRFALPNSVAPGQSVTFNVSAQAPATGGAYVLVHRLVKETEAWFDQISRTTVNVTTNAPLAATYSATLPLAWRAGEVKTYSITLTNTGYETWLNNGSTPVNLGVFFAGVANPPITRFVLPNHVAPGQSVTLSVNVQAPATSGNYVLTHRLVKETVSWFPTLLQTGVSVSKVALAATYTVAPPTKWNVSQTYSYPITLTNTGTETWLTTGTNPVHLGVYFGDSNDAPGTWSVEPLRYNLPFNVMPGQSVTINITVPAPTNLGNYTLRHRLVKEHVSWFTTQAKTAVSVVQPAELSVQYTLSPAKTWFRNETKYYTVTLTNRGTQTWNNTGANPVRLGVYFSGTNPTTTFFNLPRSVLSGQSVSFTIGVKGPATAGNYVLYHRLVKQNVSWFPEIQETAITVR
jgi:glucose/arabinose dehydrogenase